MGISRQVATAGVESRQNTAAEKSGALLRKPIDTVVQHAGDRMAALIVAAFKETDLPDRLGSASTELRVFLAPDHSKAGKIAFTVSSLETEKASISSIPSETAAELAATMRKVARDGNHGFKAGEKDFQFIDTSPLNTGRKVVEVTFPLE